MIATFRLLLARIWEEIIHMSNQKTCLFFYMTSHLTIVSISDAFISMKIISSNCNIFCLSPTSIQSLLGADFGPCVPNKLLNYQHNHPLVWS